MERKPWYKSKKLWVAIGGIITLVLQQFLPKVDWKALIGQVIIIVGYMLGESWTDVQSMKDTKE